MTNIYSVVMAVVFIALLVSACRFICRRTDFNRVTVWTCITVLVIMLAADKHFENQIEFTPEQQSALISTLRDTATELKKYNEIDEVYFSEMPPTDKLEIILLVNELATEDFLLELDSETRRTFLHAMVDNWQNPSELTGGAILHLTN